MKPNVGEKEARVRLGVGIAAAVAAITLSRSKTMSALLGIVAASGIKSGLSRYCMVNELLGIDNAPELTETSLKSVAKNFPKALSRDLKEPLYH